MLKGMKFKKKFRVAVVLRSVLPLFLSSSLALVVHAYEGERLFN